MNVLLVIQPEFQNGRQGRSHDPLDELYLCQLLSQVEHCHSFHTVSADITI